MLPDRRTFLVRAAQFAALALVPARAYAQAPDARNVWPDYAIFPDIVQALRRKGFSATDIGKIAGGNYVRVFNASC